MEYKTNTVVTNNDKPVTMADPIPAYEYVELNTVLPVGEADSRTLVLAHPYGTNKGMIDLLAADHSLNDTGVYTAQYSSPKDAVTYANPVQHGHSTILQSVTSSGVTSIDLSMGHYINLTHDKEIDVFSFKSSDIVADPDHISTITLVRTPTQTLTASNAKIPFTCLSMYGEAPVFSLYPAVDIFRFIDIPKLSVQLMLSATKFVKPVTPLVEEKEYVTIKKVKPNKNFTQPTPLDIPENGLTPTANERNSCYLEPTAGGSGKLIKSNLSFYDITQNYYSRREGIYQSATDIKYKLQTVVAGETVDINIALGNAIYLLHAVDITKFNIYGINTQIGYCDPIIIIRKKDATTLPRYIKFPDAAYNKALTQIPSAIDVIFIYPFRSKTVYNADVVMYDVQIRNNFRQMVL